MDKLGPALADCQNTTFTPWEEKPCPPKGPSWEVYTVDLKCKKELDGVFGAGDSNKFITFKELENGNIEFSGPGPKPTIFLANFLTIQAISEETKVQKILHPDWSDTQIYFQASWNVYKGHIHTALDLFGLIPIVGELADGTNAVIYLAEGDKVNASLSAISMIPVVGDAAGKGTKVTRKVLTWFKVGNRYFSSPARKAAYEVLFNDFGVKIADAIFDSRNSKLIRKAIDDAGKGLKEAWEAHHMIPKELIEEYDVIQNAIKQGFEFNKLDNLIPLEKATRHRGSHPLFTNRVRKNLDDLIQLYPRKQAKEILEMAVNDIKSAIDSQKTKHIEQIIF